MWNYVNDEVLHWDGEGTPAVTASDLDRLEAQAAANPRRRCRLLMHGNQSENLHEMVIALGRGAYIPPHINPCSPKSYIMLRGAMLVARFDQDGTLLQRQILAAADAPNPQVVRLPPNIWHMGIPLSDVAIYVEIVLGPHRTTAFAQWAPPAERTDEGQALIRAILQGLDAG